MRKRMPVELQTNTNLNKTFRLQPEQDTKNLPSLPSLPGLLKKETFYKGCVTKVNKQL
ncbi:hypothetical protein PRABACTJOHN_02821 [Parabacteroides johnsonii DSM 18315]|uniref:Uncharacterized protein n=1 Tax=Parabacteroides johnsonii DSM 18315 TaxID=537006 RepID=B7BCQ3_9BACT|nr:hypothetical protein PRABACTJOHN_02821 [Parabacteroides johnsonii DSM 18315]